MTAIRLGWIVAAHAADSGGVDPGGDSRAGTTDWSALYEQYLTRTAGQSARTLELYQKVMQSVSRHELAPNALQDMLAAFVQARGAAYTERLSELNTRFFSGLVQISTTYSLDLAELIAPGIAVPLAPPPRFDAADPARWFQQLTDYAGQVSANAVKSYQSFLNRVAAGDGAAGRIQQVSSDFMQRRAPEHLRHLSRLYFELLTGLNDLRAGYEEEFLAGVLAAARRPGEESSFVLNLVAPLGGTASASLSVANTKQEPAVVRCTVTEVRRADGVGPSFKPGIMVLPAEVELDPGKETSLVLSLRLDEAFYDADVLYVGAVEVTGHDKAGLEVPLRITATAPSV
jgi:hypothetical protein